jgi:hypothetical protein
MMRPLSFVLPFLVTACAVQPTPFDAFEPDAFPALVPPTEAVQPPPVELTLHASPLATDQSMSFRIVGAQPGETVFLARGESQGAGPCFGSAQYACLDLTGSVGLLGKRTADANGEVLIESWSPSWLSYGDNWEFQAIAPRGGSGSNAVVSNVESAPVDDALEIIGNWSDSWGGSHAISQSSWENYGVFHITQSNNAEGWLIAQNDSNNSWNPGDWSRFDWTWDGTQLWYCQTAYAAASEASALATPAADPSNPSVSGCDIFSWTRLDP